MEAIEFKGSNIKIAENQDEYITLHAFKDEEGNVVTCWRMTFLERLRALFKGKVWLHTSTFNKPLQPLFMTTERKEVLEDKKL